VETLLQAFRLSWRLLAKSPAFTAVAVLCVALGIGANTTLEALRQERDEGAVRPPRRRSAHPYAVLL
jgi:hypothetical protein